jgi:anaerobic ribonucleoside-triphosphate reductase activating protein
MDRNLRFRLAGVVRESIVDGPGLRFTVFFQGCPHHCPGCHNQSTLDFEGGTEASVGQVLDEIAKNPLLGGVTLSGGEPFAQPEALAALAEGVKARGLHLVVYSGYTYEGLSALAQGDNPDSEAIRRVLGLADWLVDGPFLQEKRDLRLAFRGSGNQRIINLPATLQKGEIVLDDAHQGVI